ncbi:MgtC/SapB family protein [Mesorhizobium xinjiangense]|uniref:MgtC/SapB family protein n=1 Tax=Mesorhizobium xinjiangense TaxID=2678685 RepID=UPI0012ECD5E6|nr:MgtC/SapB family protein [Mesorhizobium xinjiangense]
MDELIADLLQETWLPLPVIAWRLLLATLLGALVGYERERRARPAGLRTHILVCIAAATAAVLTIEIAHLSAFQTDGIRIDPIRLIEAVTAGVAFLAAGMIVFARGHVHGLTTGAGMWLAGSIGLACGLGFWQVAVIATLLAVIVLTVMRVVEGRLLGKDRRTQRRDRQDAKK